MKTVIVRINDTFTTHFEYDVRNIGDIISVIYDYYHCIVKHKDDDIIEVELPGGVVFSSNMYNSFNNGWELYVKYPGCGSEWVASFCMNA